MSCQKWKKIAPMFSLIPTILNLENNIFKKVASTSQKMFFTISIFVDLHQKVILKRKKLLILLS